MGVAYKKNVDDLRESPAFKLMEIIERRGASTGFYDAYVACIPNLRAHPQLFGRHGIPALSRDVLSSFDAVLIMTDHDNVVRHFARVRNWLSIRATFAHVLASY